MARYRTLPPTHLAYYTYPPSRVALTAASLKQMSVRQACDLNLSVRGRSSRQKGTRQEETAPLRGRAACLSTGLRANL